MSRYQKLSLNLSGALYLLYCQRSVINLLRTEPVLYLLLYISHLHGNDRKQVKRSLDALDNSGTTHVPEITNIADMRASLLGLIGG